jgi:5-methylcytosine-specific restriction endonuclease McrA
MFTHAERRSGGLRLIVRDGGFFCFYCKTPLDGSYHIDHKTPYARGGEHQLENFALACLQCNQEKHSKTLEEYREWLHQRGEAVGF